MMKLGKGSVVRVKVELDRSKHFRTFRPKIGALGVIVGTNDYADSEMLYRVAFALPQEDAADTLWFFDIEELGNGESTYTYTMFLAEELEVLTDGS